LFARRGVQATGHIGYVREAEDGFICGTGAIRLRLTEHNGQVLADFMSHVLANPSSIEWFKFHAIGATMPNLNEGIIRSFSFVLPSPKVQLAISALLNALDDNIDLNRRMNETLEAMARTIFKDWFVDFGPTRAQIEGYAPYLAPEIWSLFPERLENEGKPKGWELSTLGKIARPQGQSVKPNELSPHTPYIGLEHMPRRSLALDSWEGAGKVTSGKLAFRRGDILFGKLRPYFHKVGIAPLDGICSTDIVVLAAREPSASAFVICCVSSDEFVAYTDLTSGGTKMPRTSWEVMERYSLYLPQIGLMQAFQRIVDPLFRKIVSSIHETRTLANVRDLLLPKLMSGEIRVKDAEKIAEAAL
jgi:type I restriction enzyme S subunit